ncbi:MAG: hypothetical protein JNK05_13370 [Myxococcales bacterium]|nr:hypothetical protein [Myxococcales bacterium]
MFEALRVRLEPLYRRCLARRYTPLLPLGVDVVEMIFLEHLTRWLAGKIDFEAMRKNLSHVGPRVADWCRRNAALFADLPFDEESMARAPSAEQKLHTHEEAVIELEDEHAHAELRARQSAQLKTHVAELLAHESKPVRVVARMFDDFLAGRRQDLPDRRQIAHEAGIDPTNGGRALRRVLDLLASNLR